MMNTVDQPDLKISERLVKALYAKTKVRVDFEEFKIMVKSLLSYINVINQRDRFSSNIIDKYGRTYDCIAVPKEFKELVVPKSIRFNVSCEFMRRDLLIIPKFDADEDLSYFDVMSEITRLYACFRTVPEFVSLSELNKNVELSEIYDRTVSDQELLPLSIMKDGCSGNGGFPVWIDFDVIKVLSKEAERQIPLMSYIENWLLHLNLG